jgi:antitoxin FitA
MSRSPPTRTETGECSAGHRPALDIVKVRAAQHGRSTEAEIREILQEAVRPETRVKIGSELAAFGRGLKGLDLKVARDRNPTEPVVVE